MTKYSGRTTAFEHKFDHNWKEYPKNIGDECIRQVTLFDVQWSNCPIEIQEEVKKMWQDYHLGNDNYMIKWYWEDNPYDYPIIAEFFKSKGITREKNPEIIIHWWW